MMTRSQTCMVLTMITIMKMVKRCWMCFFDLEGCPSGWHKLYSTCYMVTDLTLMVNNTLDARSQCLAKGADLPNIRNQTVDVHLSYVMREVANREVIAQSISLNTSLYVLTSS